MSIHVQLARFEGPLGLLLHLIREQEMDIFNINIHEITRQYLEYIKAIKRLDLEVAGDFVAMAATLLQIKSRLLLPNYQEEGAEPEEDPRQELVRKLVEYNKFKELSADLYRRPLLGRDVFERGASPVVESDGEGELILEDNPLFSLVRAFRSVLKNVHRAVHQVAGELQSIAARILQLKEKLIVGQRQRFSELIDSSEHRASQILVTFLSLLELAKIGFVSLFQADPSSEIHVQALKVIERDVVSQVESYDGINGAQVATEMIIEAQMDLPALDNEPLPEVDLLAETEKVPLHEVGVEAATDADIEAEEARLFAEETKSNIAFLSYLSTDDELMTPEAVEPQSDKKPEVES